MQTKELRRSSRLTSRNPEPVNFRPFTRLLGSTVAEIVQCGESPFQKQRFARTTDHQASGVDLQHCPPDALLASRSEDTTQEILIRVITKLSTFEGRSSFRTWLYRLVINHVLNLKRRKSEGWDFTRYKVALDAMPDKELPDPHSIPADIQLVVEEAKIGCTTGVLLCLDREQRLIYVLSEIFGATDAVGAELFEITRENFRQKLLRARRDLHA